MNVFQFKSSNFTAQIHTQIYNTHIKFFQMRILLSYLKNYKKYIFLALILATVNQVFSLMDSVVIRHLVDDYGSKVSSYKNNYSGFIWGVMYWVGIAIGVAMISRIAKNFQDYFTNVVTQRVGADIYKKGITHSLAYLTKFLKTNEAEKLWENCKKHDKILKG